MSRAPGVALVALAGLLLAGCESTQDKSARLRKRANTLLSQRTQTLVTRTNPDVRVLHTAALHDENGSAAVVELRNTSPRGLLNVPVAIDVRGAHGASVFRNDTAGIEPSLIGPSFLPPRSSFIWVNDQVTAGAGVRSVLARVGTGSATPPKTIPPIRVTPPRLEVDPTSGISAVGKVTNGSSIPQRHLILYCVARKGGRIVAAGRGGIDRLKPNKPTRYTIFFIGDPRGAKLIIDAPPTTFS
jgi:hypothetical protein